jgi:predicted  nucleic acid-binding Zn-ribbon protein
MKCNECDIEFTPTRLNVDAQKYCSIKCRNLSEQKRRHEKIISDYQSSKENSISNIIGENNRENREIEFTPRTNYNRESNNNIIENGNNDFNARIGLIETNFNTKSELILCRIQLDYANKEIEELKQKVKNLEVEIFTLENEEEEVNPQMEVVNNLIKGFSTDPVGVLNFAKEMFKSKIA